MSAPHSTDTCLRVPACTPALVRTLQFCQAWSGPPHTLCIWGQNQVRYCVQGATLDCHHRCRRPLCKQVHRARTCCASRNQSGRRQQCQAALDGNHTPTTMPPRRAPHALRTYHHLRKTDVLLDEHSRKPASARHPHKHQGQRGVGAFHTSVRQRAWHARIKHGSGIFYHRSRHRHANRDTSHGEHEKRAEQAHGGRSWLCFHVTPARWQFGA